MSFYRTSSFIFNKRKFVELYFNGQECKVRPQIVNVNSDEPVFYPFNTKTSKCGGSYNNINYSYGKMCVPKKVL